MRAPRVGPWGPKVHGGGAARGAAVEPVSSGVMDSGPPCGDGRGQAASVHIRSGGRDRQGECAEAKARRCVGSHERGRVHLYGARIRPVRPPHRAARQDRARRRANHGDGSDTCPCGRRTSGSLTETRVRDWQSWPARVDGSADRHMTPCPLDGTDHRARHVLAACIESDGPVDADGDQALVIDDARHPTFLPGGEAARPWDAATGALVRRPRRRRCSWPRLVAHLADEPDVTWLVNGLAAKEGIEPSGP